MNVGFAWGVRVSAIICFVFCTTATITVTSGIPPEEASAKEAAPWFDLRALKDPKFSLLVLGSCFMAFGERSCPPPSSNLPNLAARPNHPHLRSDGRWGSDTLEIVSQPPLPR